MSSLPKSYAEQVRDGLSLAATWIPSSLANVGDVGTFIDGVFVKSNDLALLKIPFSTQPSANQASITFSSKSGVSIQAKAAGQTSAIFTAVGQASAGVAVSFERSAGAVMSLTDVNAERLHDQPALEAELRQRLNAGVGWQEDWAVVIERFRAKSGTIVISRDAGTKVEFEAKGDLPAGGAALGSISTGVSLAYSDAMAQLIVGEDGLTPLFRTMRLKRTFWTGSLKPVYQRVADDVTTPAPPPVGVEVPDDAFEEVVFDDQGPGSPG